jgi:hypothetical protein
VPFVVNVVNVFVTLATERLGKLKKIIGSRTRDLLACTIVP